MSTIQVPERFGGEGGEAVSLAISSSLEVIDPIPEDDELDDDSDDDLVDEPEPEVDDEMITAPEDVLGLALLLNKSELVDSGSQVLLSADW